MAEDQKPETDPKLLILGFVVGAITIGVAIWIILKGIRDTLSGLGNGHGLGQQPINIYNVTGPQAPLQLPAPLQAQAPLPIQPSQIANDMQLGAISLGTRTDTLLLSTTAARRVFSAPIKGPTWKVRIAAIGPAGSFAVLAVDVQPSADGGRSVIVPAGDHTELIIGPRQIISGIALNADTQVSYVAQAEVV